MLSTSNYEVPKVNVDRLWNSGTSINNRNSRELEVSERIYY
ncbi:4293_t:CDS:2 [Diversispora eburnea]|uniref:4293_t:CDS:1 n=1 Tax=Diversispora eburnea TaxID=1213867 RepID=A0A9N8ZD33_9GLOM|nr:4293_t:CDS:2 [Diversispora eburnea]